MALREVLSKLKEAFQTARTRMMVEMLSSNMATLVAGEILARDHKGRPLLYGRFCVEHSAKKDRLILDGRLPSVGEGRLQWMRLPHGSQLARLRLSPAHSVRGSGGDLRTWFYQVREAIENASRRGLGRVITGPDAAKLKLDPKRKWRLALAVIAMGGF